MRLLTLEIESEDRLPDGTAVLEQCLSNAGLRCVTCRDMHQDMTVWALYRAIVDVTDGPANIIGICTGLAAAYRALRTRHLRIRLPGGGELVLSNAPETRHAGEVTSEEHLRTSLQQRYCDQDRIDAACHYTTDDDWLFFRQVHGDREE